MRVRGSSDEQLHVEKTIIAAIVGIDGCGKTSTFRDAVDRLSKSVPTAGVGNVVLSGGPGKAVRERTDIPMSRAARTVGALAKSLRRPGLYKDLKLVEFTERTHVRDHILVHDAPAVVVTDGDPLVNSAAWAVARYSRRELTGDDERLVDVLHYLAGDRRIPARELPYYLRHGWQIALLNRLHIARFGFPDLVFLLQIEAAIAMERIRARGRPLQAHENEAFLAELAAAYERVGTILETRCGVRVVRLPVVATAHEQTVQAVVDAALASVATRGSRVAAGPFRPDTIEVVATTMSGSFEDQRKVDHIEPAFRAVTDREVRVHRADTHLDAEHIAHEIVGGGGRTLVSAGGAGTFNAVLEGCHVDGGVPSDLRLAFLRKGSADLIGKALHVPDELAAAAWAIANGIAAGNDLPADILAVEASEPDGTTQLRHIVGFGGLGIFGDIPRFTESRLIKYYKGLLGTLFGDLGPFYTGLTLATLGWLIKRLFGRVPEISVTLDGETLPAERWAAVVILNGDLGRDFPLGRGRPLGSNSFRVVALHYRGLRVLLRQVGGCRTAALLDDPDAHNAIVRNVQTLVVRPLGPCEPFMINVDGLRLLTRGTIRVSVSGRVLLVDAAPQA